MDRELFISFDKIPNTYYVDLFYKLMVLEFNLYDNMYFDKDGLVKNNSCVTNMSYCIYSLFQNTDNIFTKDLSSRLRENLYRNLKGLLKEDKALGRVIAEHYNLHINEFMLYKKQKKSMVDKALHFYIKILVDNIEIELLNETFFSDFLSEINGNMVQYNFDILAYIYYLAECEDLVDEDKKAKYRDMIISHNQTMDMFMYSIGDLIEKDKISIKNTKNTYSHWERYPKKGCKTLVWDSTIDSFAIYCIIYSCNKDIDEMIKFASIIAQGKEYDFYIRFSVENIPKYKNFVKLFFGEDITDKEVKEKIELFHQACKILYKDSIIDKSREMKLNKHKLESIELDVKNEVNVELSNVISSFKNKTESTETIPLEYTINTEAVTFKTGNWFNTNFLSELKDWFIKVIIYHTIRSKLKEKNIIFKSQQMLDEFLNKCSDFDIDTILRGGINYYRYLKKDEYLEFIKSKNQLNTDNLYNIAVALDSSKCYFKIKNVGVKIRHRDMNEFEDKYEVINENEYLCSINGIPLSFTKEELEEYIHNDKYQITIDIELEYGFSSDNFGVALFGNEEEKVIN